MKNRGRNSPVSTDCTKYYYMNEKRRHAGAHGFINFTITEGSRVVLFTNIVTGAMNLPVF